MEKIHQLHITFSIVTKGSEPLELDDATKAELMAGFDLAVAKSVDLRYHPEGNRYQESWHKLLGTGLVEVKAL